MSGRRKSFSGGVFISHSHRDRHTAVELQKVLKEHNAQTFLDQDRIDVAENLPARVRDGIARCDSLLLLWSARAAASSWVQQEWQMAHGLRKKIIPYVLDRTPLPSTLEDLVYIEASDQQHGDAQLLKAVFGKGVKVDPTKLFPGLWQASVDAFGMAQGTYDLELRDNGQVEGEGGVSDSGLAGQMAHQMGMSGLLSMRIPLHGSWSYDRRSKTLTIETSTGVVFGQQQNDTIRIRATGHEKGAITGKDLGGRTWTLRRVGESARSGANEARQKIRDGFQQILERGEDSPALAVVLAAYCVGAQEKSEYDLGLPTDEAHRVMKTQGGAFQAAFKDFVRALERGGWIR